MGSMDEILKYIAVAPKWLIITLWIPAHEVVHTSPLFQAKSNETDKFKCNTPKGHIWMAVSFWDNLS